MSPVGFAQQLDHCLGLPHTVTGQTDVLPCITVIITSLSSSLSLSLPDIPLSDGLQDQCLVTGVPGHCGHLVQQQPIMIPDYLEIIIIIIIIIMSSSLTLLGGLLSMEQVMKADLRPPASDLTRASPGLTEGGSSKWSWRL